MSSTGSRVQLEPAFILHRRAYRETSLLLEVLSRDFGRTGLIARGARTKRSGLYATLQPFRLLLLSWVSRGELGTLRDAENQGTHSPIAGAAVASGFYLNELLMRLLHRGDPHPGLFDRYLTALQALCDNAAGPEPVLRVFEKRLLQELGYGLVMDVEAIDGEPIDASSQYVYEVERGPVPYTGGAQEGVRVRGKTLLCFAAERLEDDATLREAKQLMRYVLRRYLGDRPVGSRVLLENPL